MLFSTFGGTGLRLSKLGLGCGRLGCLSEREAEEIIHGALALGMNLFDTADCYQSGESERKLGLSLIGRRSQAVIATKFRHVPAYAGASRRSIRIAVEESLKRLNTDYIDLYQLHAPDPTTPIEETIQVLQDLVREGKILYFGLCNVKPWQLVDAYHVAHRLGNIPLAGVQCQANILSSSYLDEMSEVLQKFHLGFLAASPLGRGVLGGNYDMEHPPRAGHPLLSQKGLEYWHDNGISFSTELRKLATEHEVSTANLSISLLLSNPNVSSALAGASSIDQLKNTIGNGFFHVQDEVLAWYKSQKATF